ncbi:VVA0879 family protein [Streptomyces anandii]|uniref:VVA0879 family protein n=1 Tax=Streptomyces anandii TaxID=285454 RepID=UPI00379B7A70
MNFAHRELTQAELWAEARERFGRDTLNWAFQCPSCGDVATGEEIRDALTARPQVHSDSHLRAGRPVEWTDVLGQQCIGRLLAELGGSTSRGCMFAAFGLIPAPWLVTLPHSSKPQRCFPLAPAPNGEVTGHAGDPC